MKLEILKTKPSEQIFLEKLQAAVVPELNIYNQAHLELETPLIKTNQIHAKTQHETGIIFHIDGELRGKFVCLMDLYNKTENEDCAISLFNESMNILVGKILTSLEIHSDIMSVITRYKRIGKTDQITLQMEEKSELIQLSLGYKLISGLQEYTCRIYLITQKKDAREV